MRRGTKSLSDQVHSPRRRTELPPSLPCAHLTVARRFDSIVNIGQLNPQYCTRLHTNILYLFYGGVFHRTSQSPTRNRTELPIAFLFDPTELASVSDYYPFDTGAVVTGKFGSWSKRLRPINQYRVSGDGNYESPARMVHHIFGTNSRYLAGKPSTSCTRKPAPLPNLFKFLCADLSREGVDHRQCSIECHVKSPLAISRSLIWIGFPYNLMKTFCRLLDVLKPYRPQFFTYHYHAAFRPSEVAAQLESQADQVVRRYVSQIPEPTL